MAPQATATMTAKARAFDRISMLHLVFESFEEWENLRRTPERQASVDLRDGEVRNEDRTELLKREGTESGPRPQIILRSSDSASQSATDRWSSTDSP
jgi:hypothetical protein